MSDAILKVLFFNLQASSLIFEILALLLKVIKDLLLLCGQALVDEPLLGLYVLNLAHLGFSLFALILKVGDDFLIALSCDGLLAQKELLFLLENSIDVVLIAVGLRELVLEHRNDVLDLVDVGVHRLRLPGALSEVLKELDALHLGLVNQIHVFRFLLDEFLFKEISFGVRSIDLSQVLVVVGLKLLGNLSDLSMLDLEFLQLSRSDIHLEIKGFPLRVNVLVRHDVKIYLRN